MSVYCIKGRELLLDLKRAEWLPQYDEEAVRSIVQEMNDLWQKLQASAENYRSMDEIPPEMKVRLIYLQECVNRNVLYVNAFMNHRIEKVRELRWEAGPVIPESISRDVLSGREREYFTKYNEVITDYIEDLGIDVTSDLEPPKELQIEIRVLEDCGEIMTENGPLRLAKNAIVFARRSAVESFIREGRVQHILQDGEC